MVGKQFHPVITEVKDPLSVGIGKNTIGRDVSFLGPVVFGKMLFDRCRFHQQGQQFVAGQLVVYGSCFTAEPNLMAGLIVEMTQYPSFDVFGFPYIDDLPFFILKVIDAGAGRDLVIYLPR